jgi:hypothetical protein
MLYRKEIQMESRKKGIAISAITALVAYKPSTKVELVVAGCVTLIALAAIYLQAKSDDKEKPDAPSGETTPPAS